MLRQLVPCLSLALLTSPALTAQGLTFDVDEDVSLGAIGAVPMAAPLDDWAIDAARQSNRLIALGGSYATPIAYNALATVSSVAADGSLLWSWTSEAPGEGPVAFFAPEAGAGAFVALETADGSALVHVEDGALVWRREIEIEVVDLAGSADGARLFALTDSIQGPRAVAFDPSTGDLLWSADIPATVNPVGLACDAAGARAFALGEAANELLVDRVDAFDGVTGAELWEVGVTALVGLAEMRAIATDPAGSVVAVALADQFGDVDVLGLDGASGADLFGAAVPGGVHALAMDPVEPSVLAFARDPDELTGATSAVIHAIRPTNGEVKWSAPLPTPSKVGGEVFWDVDPGARRLAVQYDASPFSAVEPDRAALALLDLESDGALLFALDELLPVGEFLRLGGVALLEDAGIPRVARWSSTPAPAGTHEEYQARAFDATGAPVWETAFGSQVAVFDGFDLTVPVQGAAVFALLRDGGGLREVAALDRDDATLLWQTELAGNSDEFSSPGAGEPLVATLDGGLVCAARAGSFTFQSGGVDGVDGATGAVLWSTTWDNYGNPCDLAMVEAASLPGSSGPVLYVLHDSDGDEVSGRTSMRAVDAASGTTLWAEDWPSSGFDDWTAATLAVDAPDGRVFALVGAQLFIDELRVLERDALTGALLASTPLVDADFAPTDMGFPVPLDLALSADGDTLYVLAKYLGGVGNPGRLAFAAVDTQTKAVLWGAAIASVPDGPLTEFAELVLSEDGAELAIVADAAPVSEEERAWVLGVDPSTGDSLWQRTLGSAGDPRGYLDAERGADGRTLAIALERADGVGEVVTLDLATGVTLHAVTADGASLGDRLVGLAVEDGATWALSDSTTTAPAGAAAVVRLDPDALVSGPDAVSIGAPEPAAFLIDLPADAAGDLYLIAGSASGTEPGIPFGGVVVPLALDAYLLASLNLAGQAPFLDTFGTLDPQGDARAALAVPADLDPSLVGAVLHHAFVRLTPGFSAVEASEPVALRLDP